MYTLRVGYRRGWTESIAEWAEKTIIAIGAVGLVCLASAVVFPNQFGGLLAWILLTLTGGTAPLTITT
jgi:hypothetical protein